MKVKQIMKKAVFVNPNATKKELLKIAKKHPNTKIFVIIDKKKQFLGDIHENDLFYMFIPNKYYETAGMNLAFDLEKKFFAKTAKQVMREHDTTCNQNDEIIDVALNFARIEINEMPVLNEKGLVVGVIDQGTILRYLKIK